MEKICPEILIISNKHDYSTDHVAFQLEKMDASYLRLNRDQFSNFEINLDPVEKRFYGKTRKFYFEIIPEKLKSIYFRAPVYIRTNYQLDLSLNEQLSRSQWASFVRSLVVFNNVLWINDPQATYKAEIKPYQLDIANKIGFDIPKTLITNTVPNKNLFDKELVIKTIDPAIFNLGDKEAFIYTNKIDYDELLSAELSTAPVMLQELLVPKIDVRVTVVDCAVFAVTIKKDGKGLDIDWRLEKNNVQYNEIKLPRDIEEKCLKLVNNLNLKFGCIDLVIYKNKYYFLEINPTGEWDWLMHHTGLDIDVKIAKLLMLNK